MTFAQRTWLEAEFAKKIEFKECIWAEFQKVITEKWSDRSIKGHMERACGDIGGTAALELPMAKRIRQFFDAVAASG